MRTTPYGLRLAGITLLLATSIGAIASEQFHLITFLYNESHPVRQQEYLHCLEKNLSNEHIVTVDIFFELPDDVSDGSCEMIDEINRLPVRARADNRISIIPCPGRPSFNNIIAHAQERYPDDKIIVANGDMFFDGSLSRVTTRHLEGVLLAISRWEPASDFGWKPWDEAGKTVRWRPYNQVAGQGDNRLVGECWALCSQDVWVFKTPFTCTFPDDLILGMPGCDNRIPYWAHRGGYKIFNPVFDVRCYHMHSSGIRTSRFSGGFPWDAAGVFASILPEPNSDEWHVDHVSFKQN